MSETKLNWESARVKDAGLSVELDGKVSKDWKHSFADTVKMLGNGQWGEVKLKKQTVHVDDVAPGQEDNLRFFLESVVEQANTSIAARDEEAAEAEDDGARDEQQARSGPDAEMTERFRSFSAAEPEDSSDSD